MTAAPDPRYGKLGARLNDAEPLRWPIQPVAAALSAVLVVLLPLLGRLVGTVSWGGCFCGERASTWPIGITVMVWHSALAVLLAAVLARAIVGSTRHTSAEVAKAVVPAAGGTIFSLPFIAAFAGGAKVDGSEWSAMSMALAVPPGVLLGVVLTLVALRKSELAPAVWLHVSWIWLLGVFSVVLSWGDDVRQTVPLGAAYLGGPESGAQPIDKTVYEALLSVLKLVSFLGPVIIGVFLTVLVMRKTQRARLAFFAGVFGPAAVLAAFLLRPDAIAQANSEWFSLAVRTMILTTVASAITALLVAMLRHPLPTGGAGPVVAVELKPEDASRSFDSKSVGPQAAAPPSSLNNEAVRANAPPL